MEKRVRDLESRDPIGFSSVQAGRLRVELDLAEPERAGLSVWVIALIWISVVVIAVLGFVVLWHTPSNLFGTLMMWPLVLWAAIAPNGEEPR